MWTFSAMENCQAHYGSICMERKHMYGTEPYVWNGNICTERNHMYERVYVGMFDCNDAIAQSV